MKTHTISHTIIGTVEASLIRETLSNSVERFIVEVRENEVIRLCVLFDTESEATDCYESACRTATNKARKTSL